VAREKYIVFPSGVDFSRVLGERGVFVGGGAATTATTTATVDVDVAKFELGRIELEAEELAEEDDLISGDEGKDISEDEDELRLQQPNGTEASMKEVQGLVEHQPAIPTSSNSRSPLKLPKVIEEEETPKKPTTRTKMNSKKTPPPNPSHMLLLPRTPKKPVSEVLNPTKRKRSNRSLALAREP
jgi:hypothetical protein